MFCRDYVGVDSGIPRLASAELQDRQNSRPEHGAQGNYLHPPGTENCQSARLDGVPARNVSAIQDFGANSRTGRGSCQRNIRISMRQRASARMSRSKRASNGNANSCTIMWSSPSIPDSVPMRRCVFCLAISRLSTMRPADRPSWKSKYVEARLRLLHKHGGCSATVRAADGSQASRWRAGKIGRP